MITIAIFECSALHQLRESSLFVSEKSFSIKTPKKGQFYPNSSIFHLQELNKMFAAASFVSSSSFLAGRSSSSLRTRTRNTNNNNNTNSGRRGELHVLCAASKSRSEKTGGEIERRRRRRKCS